MLKLTGDGSEALGQNVAVFSQQVRIATVEAELILGLWLISGMRANAARWAAIGFFGILAAVSLWLGWQGRSSCGCFGRIALHPWTTLVFDLMAMLLLFVFKPRGDNRPATPWVPDILKTAGYAALILILAAGGVMAALGVDLPTALARLRGEVITIEPAVAEVGSGVNGTWTEFTIRIINRDSAPIRLTGGTSTCACQFLGDLPLTVAAGSHVDLPVRVKFAGSPGRFLNQYTIYTDDSRQWAMNGRVAGTVVEASPGGP